jgi:hypothetical protein
MDKQDYVVSWTTTIDATSPLEAAQDVALAFIDADLATIFVVCDEKGREFIVDVERGTVS